MKAFKTHGLNFCGILCRFLSAVRPVFTIVFVHPMTVATCTLALTIGSNSTAFAKSVKKTAPTTEVAPVQAEVAPPESPGSLPAPTASASCVGCHGLGGVSTNDLWPNLAGQKRDYLAKQLRAFRSGERTDPMMSAIVQTLKDSDVDELARYFSSLKGKL